MKKKLELSVKRDGGVYETEVSRHPQHIIGYHIGKMVSEDEEGFVEDQEADELYIEEGYGMPGLSHVLEFGKRILATRK